MLHTTYNLINRDELEYLRQVCNDFDNRQIDKVEFDDKTNFYNRLILKQTDVQSYQNTLVNFLKGVINTHNFDVLELPRSDSWINKVIPETNKNDAFHVDDSFLTAVTYLNEDFTGGNFEYIDEVGRRVRIKPKTNMTLIMDKTLSHRVTPVKTGTRFSLITFFQFTPKQSKTLL